MKLAKLKKLFDKRALTILVSTTIIVTLVAVILIILIFSNRNKRALQMIQQRQRLEMEVLNSTTDFGIEDFFRDTRDPQAGITYPLWNRKKSWTVKELQEFWIDPAEAGMGELKEDNDELIKKSLGKGN